MSIQVIAMHGWAGDSRGWQPFAAAARRRGWRWQSVDRGYGRCEPVLVRWLPEDGLRVLVAHSLGPHLLDADVLTRADALVLLASFGRFLPPGREGRRLGAALAAMGQSLRGPEPEAMLRAFLAEAAAPRPLSELPVTIADDPLPLAGRQRLLDDLTLLAHCQGLPAALPAAAPCLIVEAGADRIVAPHARTLLRQERAGATLIHYPQAGHCLLGTSVLPDLLAWIGNL
ncbi:MAG: alpha/beta hydrolase [Cyanobacteria bacterium J06638_7]